MVLQLCGRVCRRLSFENPIQIGWGFLLLENIGAAPEPSLSSRNPSRPVGRDFPVFGGGGFVGLTAKMQGCVGSTLRFNSKECNKFYFVVLVK
jgi:hypothetical protein